jgi:hypothetical protein
MIEFRKYSALGENRHGEDPSAAGEGRNRNKINRKKILRLSWFSEKCG